MISMSKSLARATAVAMLSGSAAAMAQATPANGSQPVTQGNASPQTPRPGIAPQAPTQPGAEGLTGAPGTSSSRSGAAAVSSSTERLQFDINNGSEASMQSELGVSAGEARALREYRDKNGRISANTPLEDVPGLTAESRQKMQGKLRYDGSPGSVADTTERQSPNPNP